GFAQNRGQPIRPRNLPKRAGSALLLFFRRLRTPAQWRESSEESHDGSSLLRLLGFRLIDHTPAHNGSEHFGRSNLMRIDVKNVLRNDNQVSGFARFERTFGPFPASGVRRP